MYYTRSQFKTETSTKLTNLLCPFCMKWYILNFELLTFLPQIGLQLETLFIFGMNFKFHCQSFPLIGKRKRKKERKKMEKRKKRGKKEEKGKKGRKVNNGNGKKRE